MTKLYINTDGVQTEFNRLKSARDALNTIQICRLIELPVDYMGGYYLKEIVKWTEDNLGKPVSEVVKQWTYNANKYATSYNAYVNASKSFNALLDGYYSKINVLKRDLYNYYAKFHKIFSYLTAFKSETMKMYEPKEIAMALNMIVDTFGLSGQFYIDVNESGFENIVYQYVNDKGEIEYHTLAELVNCFISFNVRVLHNEARFGTQETQKDVYVATHQEVELERKVGLYQITSEVQAAAFVKSVYGEQYPELAEIDPISEDAMKRIKDVMGIEDLSEVYGDGIESVEASLISLVMIDASTAGIAYTITQDGKLHINYEDGVKNYIDFDALNLDYDESLYEYDDNYREELYTYLKDHDYKVSEKLEEWAEESGVAEKVRKKHQEEEGIDEPLIDETQENEEDLYIDKNKIFNEGYTSAVTTGGTDSVATDNIALDENGNPIINPNDGEQSVLSENNQMPAEETNGSYDWGNSTTNIRNGLTSGSSTGGSGSASTGGSNNYSYSYNDGDTYSFTGNNSNYTSGTGSFTTRTPIEKMTTYDDFTNTYISGSGSIGSEGIIGGGTNALSLDIGKDYDALALQQYNNSSAEIKAAGILAVVSEANTLFDTNPSMLQSKLVSMGYSESEAAQIMQDRDLTLQAFTQNDKNEQLARISNELAEQDGDGNHVSKYGKTKSIDKLRNGDEDDEVTVAAKKQLDDSVDGYKMAVDGANAALEKAKGLKAELDEMANRFGDDTSKWSEEQYQEYSELASRYNEAVADAKVKVENVEVAKANYESAKNGYNDALNNKNQVDINNTSGAGSTGTADTGTENQSNAGVETSKGMENVNSIFEENNNVTVAVEDKSGEVGISVSKPIVTESGFESNMEFGKTVVEEEPRLESMVGNAAKASANAIANVGVEDTNNYVATNTETNGALGISVAEETPVITEPVEVNAVESPIEVSNNVASTSTVGNSLTKMVNTVKSGFSGNMSGELISVAVAVALKGASKLITGDKNQKVVLDYDELARYRYEKIDKAEREAYDSNLTKEAREMFAGNKEELIARLKGYGYSEEDAYKISEDERLTLEAMLDGGRRTQLSEIAKELAKEDGIEEYSSTYLSERSIMDLENGSSAELRVDLSGDEAFDKIREEYFGMEKNYVEFANNANRDLGNLNEAKTKYNQFIVEHGEDKTKWNEEDKTTYESLNNANLLAQQTFEETNKKFEDIQSIFTSMRATYEKEKILQTAKRKIDPTNVKELMQEPVNG